MANWDVFHSDRLEVARGLDTEAVRAGLARGEIRDDDLIRPSGTGAPWSRIGDMPALPVEPEHRAAPATVEDQTVELFDDDEEVLAEIDEDEFPDVPISPYDEGEHPIIPALPKSSGKPDRGGAGEPYGEFDLNLRGKSDPTETPSIEVESGDDGLDIVEEVNVGEEEEEEYDPLEEDEAVAEFTLSRGSAGKVEELDLAAMVDVAFQLVLFFLVTATTVLYKTLEVPKPNPEASATAPAAQGRSKTLDDLKDDFILVEIDPVGAVKIDRDPVPADLKILVERLRSERERTGRKAMLLSADFATPHKSAVLAYDAANEIGLGIAIARPKPGGP